MRVETISAGAELAEQVEDACRHRPAEYSVAAKFGTGVVGDEQNVRASCIWRD